MAFSYEVDLSDPSNAGGSADAVLVDDLNKALAVWSQYISGKGTLVVDLNIVPTPEGREDGGPTTAASSGTSASGLTLYEPSSLYELQTGQHVDGSPSDITVNVSPGYFPNLDLDPGLNADSSVAYNQLNPIVTFLHEIMHGFGMAGFYDDAGNLPGDYESTFDQFIQKTSSGTAYFTGSKAEAAHGGPVQLTTDGSSESYYHFGDTDADFYKTPSTVSDPLTLDLMNGIVFFDNYQYGISNLDLGVLKDLGYHVGPDSISIAFSNTTSGFRNGTTPVLAGTVSASDDIDGVEIYDGSSDLGAATVGPNGRWTFTSNLSSGDYANLTAVATSASGQTASAAAPYELVTGVSGYPYRAVEYDYASDGSYGYKEYSRTGSRLVTGNNNGDGTHYIHSTASDQQIYSIANDVIAAAGDDESFVFSKGFGQDEVRTFQVAGAGHDYLNLTGTQLHTLAQALNHTTQVGGNAVLHLYGNETVTLDGVTKAQLKAHPGDFLLA